MNVVMDACSIINLHNGGVLEVVCSIQSIEVQIGPISGGECSGDCAPSLAALKEAGLLEYLEDSTIESDELIAFISEHKLGDGESECIILASLDETTAICCDDMRGRRKAETILGKNRLIGSLKLLKQAVGEGLLSTPEAFAAYELMKNAGGFLPEVDETYFVADTEAG